MTKPDPKHVQAEEQLLNAEEWTDTILQSIQSGVIVIDVGSRNIIDINRAAEEMIGAPRSEIIGNVCHTFVCPEERDSCPIIDKGQMIDNKECTLLRKDGSKLQILKTASPITFDGRACLIESFIDIYGKDDFYLEIHDHGMEAQRKCKAQLIEFARAVFTARVPSFGSCWGIQLAAFAAGGQVQGVRRT